MFLKAEAVKYLPHNMYKICHVWIARIIGKQFIKTFKTQTSGKCVKQSPMLTEISKSNWKYTSIKHTLKTTHNEHRLQKKMVLSEQEEINSLIAAILASIVFNNILVIQSQYKNYSLLLETTAWRKICQKKTSVNYNRTSCALKNTQQW